MISGNYNNHNTQINNLRYGAIKDVVPNDVNQKLPESIQNIDAKEIANNNGVFAAAGKIDKKSALLTLPVYASFVALRNLNDTKGPLGFAGEYEKSFLGKLTKAGDFITKGIKKVIPDSFENFVKRKTTSSKSWLLDHSAMARSFTTPIKYENKTAIDSANGLFGRVMSDNATMFEKGYKGGVNELKELFGENTTIWDLLKKKGIESCANSKSARELVSETLKEIGESPVSDPTIKKYTKEIIESFSKSSQGIEISKWSKIPIGKIPILGKFLTLKVPASEISNKLRVAANVSGAELATGGAVVGTTVLGRTLPSVFAKVYEGLTSDFVGGKIAPAMQAYFIASAALKAKEAPKGQKLATFMDEEVGAASYLITMPIATTLLAKLGGMMKYVGMGDTKDAQKLAVDKFRDMVSVLNSKVDAGTITRGEYLNEVKNIKNQLKGNTKFWQKPFKAIGKIIGSNFKNETIKPFIDNSVPANASKLKALGLSVSNRTQELLYKFKTKGIFGQTPGGLLRFALVMFVLSPLVSKPISKLVNKIFGEPYKPEETKKAEEKKAKNQKNENQENPFVNLTEEQMVDLLQKNQINMQKAQNNPELMNELQSDPKKLYDFLIKGAEEYDKALSNQAPSQLLQNYANQVKNGQMQNQMSQNTASVSIPQNQMNNGQAMAPIQNTTTLNINNFNPNAKMPAPSIKSENANNQNKQSEQKNSEKLPEYQRSYNYIPSSAPSNNVLNAQNFQNAQLNSILQDMDNTEKKFNKYLSI